jgi:serine protease Do
MDDNRDKRTDNSSDDSGTDGEYHFIRPEQRLYEDAEFVPQDEATEVPNYYAPEEKKPRERSGEAHRSGTLKLACMCLVCALVGGLVGGFISWNAVKGNLADGTAKDNSVKPISGTTVGKRVSTETASANEIYELGCKQTVGVSLESTRANIFGQQSASAVAGTGFIITSDGYIMTNYHVIESAQKSEHKIQVLFKDKSSFEAKIVGFDEDNDVAVLKIDASDLSPVSIGNSDDIAVGDSVFAIGNPLGELDFSMTSGRVSALDRSITIERNGTAINMFQFDAAINSGNSGGPVYNESGEVIGIATAKVGSSGVEGLGFAIPINDAADIANELITKGYVSGKAYMGVNIDNRYTSVYAQYYSMPEGAYVYNVESGGCAEKSGLAAGDIITKVGSEAIGGYSDLNAAIKSFKAGESTEIVVYRGGEYVTLRITFDEAKPDAGTNGVSEFGISCIPN